VGSLQAAVEALLEEAVAAAAAPEPLAPDAEARSAVDPVDLDGAAEGVPGAEIADLVDLLEIAALVQGSPDGAADAAEGSAVERVAEGQQRDARGGGGGEPVGGAEVAGVEAIRSGVRRVGDG